MALLINRDKGRGNYSGELKNTLKYCLTNIF